MKGEKERTVEKKQAVSTSKKKNTVKERVENNFKYSQEDSRSDRSSDRGSYNGVSKGSKPESNNGQTNKSSRNDKIKRKFSGIMQSKLRGSFTSINKNLEIPSKLKGAPR